MQRQNHRVASEQRKVRFPMSKEQHQWRPMWNHVWGWIGYGRKGHLVGVDGNLNRHQYIGILGDHLIPSAEEIFDHQNPRFLFQQDNASPHTARATTTLLGEQDFQVLSWSPYSPDTNIMESVWNHIILKLREHTPQVYLCSDNGSMSSGEISTHSTWGYYMLSYRAVWQPYFAWEVIPPNIEDYPVVGHTRMWYVIVWYD